MTTSTSTYITNKIRNRYDLIQRPISSSVSYDKRMPITHEDDVIIHRSIEPSIPVTSSLFLTRLHNNFPATNINEKHLIRTHPYSKISPLQNLPLPLDQAASMHAYTKDLYTHFTSNSGGIASPYISKLPTTDSSLYSNPNLLTPPLSQRLSPPIFSRPLSQNIRSYQPNWHPGVDTFMLNKLGIAGK